MNETTVFNFSISELCQRADKLGMSFKRDQKSFVNYGYSEATVPLVAAKVAQLRKYLFDDYYAGIQKEATDAKNKIRQQLEADIKDFRNRVKLCYDTKSVDYSLFRFHKKLSRLADYALVQYANILVMVARPRLEKLSEQNITQKNLDKILQDRISLDEAIDIQSEAIANRREKKHERITHANELYTLLSEISEVGKVIWKGKNEAYYNDYVNYGSAQSIAVLTQEVETVG